MFIEAQNNCKEHIRKVASPTSASTFASTFVGGPRYRNSSLSFLGYNTHPAQVGLEQVLAKLLVNVKWPTICKDFCNELD